MVEALCISSVISSFSILICGITLAVAVYQKCATFLNTKTSSINEKILQNDIKIERNELKLNELEKEAVFMKETDPTIKEFLQRNLEQFEQLVNKQTKSENENGFQKMLEIQLDRKFEDLEIELKKSQVQLFADFENQQKLFLEQLRYKTKMLSYLDSKFDELKKETKESFSGQNQIVKNQCKKIQSALVNQTKQQGLIQNLVLDLKNY